MAEIILHCTCCGCPCAMPDDLNLLSCPACGTQNARPAAKGESLELLQRAIDQRRACDFVNAEASYQRVLGYSPREHEALWGLLLCRYGVEYVKDNRSGQYMPTVHTVHPMPLRANQEFAEACRNAPEDVRAQYERDGAYIDEAQERIRELAKSCPAYDVFLCHKTTQAGSDEKTQDYVRALELYHLLKGNGYRVFFAPVSLRDVAGANYEAGIYHALHTARVMLLVCSDEEQLVSPWVQSEWSRYLALMNVDTERRLAPLLYEHFSPKKLPQQLAYRNLQGLDMSQLSAKDDLLGLVQGAMVEKPVSRKRNAKALWIALAMAAALLALVVWKPWAAETGDVPAELSAQPGGAEVALQPTEGQGEQPSAVAAGQDPYAVGSIVTFGEYNGQALTWLVLKVENGKALLLAEKAVENRPYHEEVTSVTWAESDLHAWLNEDFYEAAFDPVDQVRMAATTVVAEDNEEYGTEAGADTQDKLFLLSIGEVEKYLPEMESRICYDAAGVEQEWWLRTPGEHSTSAAGVWSDGAVGMDGHYVNRPISARPAFWLNLEISDAEAAQLVEEAAAKKAAEEEAAQKAAEEEAARKAEEEAAEADEEEPTPNEAEPTPPPTEGATQQQAVEDPAARRAQEAAAKKAQQAAEEEEARLAAEAADAAWREQYPIGSIVTLGELNGEPLTWQVLEVKDGKALLLAEYSVAEMAYHSKYTAITWENCTLRTWLNNDFINTAFSAEERNRIATTTVIAEDNDRGTSVVEAGDDADDKVFLLSLSEVEEYLPTNFSRICYDANGDAKWWWLRSPGYLTYYAAGVSSSGAVDAYGNPVSYDYAVRPALWLNLAP